MRKIKLIAVLLSIAVSASAQWQPVVGKYNYRDSFQLSKYKNNAARDSVLQTDSSGKIRQVALGTIVSTNIYNSNGTLTGSRTLTNAGYNLTMSGIGYFGVGVSPAYKFHVQANDAGTFATGIYNSNATGKGLGVSVNNSSSSLSVLQALGNGGATSLFDVRANGDIYAPLLSSGATTDSIMTWNASTKIVRKIPFSAFGSPVSGTGAANLVNVWTGTTTQTGYNNYTYFDAPTTGTGLFVNNSVGTSGSLVKFQSLGTAATGNTKKVLEIVSAGANANVNQTVTGQTISVTNTNGTSGTNVGLSVSASGATTANNAIVVPAGNVGIGTTTPDASAKLDVSSTVNGMLIPRMTNAQMNAIPSPANGLIVYNTTNSDFEYWNTAVWKVVGPTFSLIDGSGTTAAGTAVNLGGTLDRDFNIETAAYNFRIRNSGYRFLDMRVADNMYYFGDIDHFNNGQHLFINDDQAKIDLVNGPPNIMRLSPDTWEVGDVDQGFENHSLKFTEADGSFYIKDGTLAGASNGYVWTLDNYSDGLGAWAPSSITLGHPIGGGITHKILYDDGGTLAEDANFTYAPGATDYPFRIVGPIGGGFKMGNYPLSSTVGAIWSDGVTPSSTNFALSASSGVTILNAPTTAAVQIAGVSKLVTEANRIYATSTATTGTGTSAAFSLTANSLTTGEAINISSTSATTGTPLMIKMPTGYTGNYVDYQLNAVSKYSISSAGNVTTAGTLTAGTTCAIVGTATNNNATAGNIGEYVESLIASGSATSLTTATAKNVTSISLTAGDWDVYGNINFIASTATVTGTSGGTTSTSATVPTDGSEVFSGIQVTVLSETDGISIPLKRFSLSGTTTVYLVGKCTFSAGTVTAFGKISARRVR